MTLEEMSDLDSEWLRWTFWYPSPDVERDPRKAFSDGYVAGMLYAAQIVGDKFYGGPTQDMILGWLADATPAPSWSEHK